MKLQRKTIEEAGTLKRKMMTNKLVKTEEADKIETIKTKLIKLQRVKRPEVTETPETPEVIEIIGIIEITETVESIKGEMTMTASQVDSGEKMIIVRRQKNLEIPIIAI